MCIRDLTMNELSTNLYSLCDHPDIRGTFGYNEYDPEDHVIYLNWADNTFADRLYKRYCKRSEKKNMSFYHELAHAFCEIYQIGNGDLVPELFGDFSADYCDESLVQSRHFHNHVDFLTLYGQTHPEEDFADCFAFLVSNNNVISGRERFSDKVLGKLKYVQRCIKEVQADY